MASSSQAKLVIELQRLPLLPGALELARKGNKTRASASNRSFVESILQIAPDVDPLLLEFAFDAQTSGGLLISVAPERADELVDRAREGGAELTCVVGFVESRDAKAVEIRV